MIIHTSKNDKSLLLLSDSLLYVSQTLTELTLNALA